MVQLRHVSVVLLAGCGSSSVDDGLGASSKATVARAPATDPTSALDPLFDTFDSAEARHATSAERLAAGLAFFDHVSQGSLEETNILLQSEVFGNAAAAGDPLTAFGSDGPSFTVAWDLEGDTAPITGLEMFAIDASYEELAERNASLGAELRAFVDEYEDAVEYVYAANIGGIDTVGFAAVATRKDGTSTLSLLPYDTVEAGSALTPAEVARFVHSLVNGEADADDDDLSWMWGGVTGAAGYDVDATEGEGGGDPCDPEAILACVKRVDEELKRDLDKADRDYKKAINRAREDAEAAADRLVGGGFLGALKLGARTVFTLGVEPVLTAVGIWEDLDRAEKRAAEDWAQDVCDAKDKAKRAALDCLRDCPAEIRAAYEARLNAWMAESGCP